MRETESPKPAESSYNIPNEEVIRRLRAKGQPIRLFGESDKERRLRLRALELIEEVGHDRLGGQNDFKKALEDVEKSELEKKNGGTKGKKKDDNNDAANSVLDLSLLKTDKDKLYPLIYYALKRTLKEWAEAMDERPGTYVAVIRARHRSYSAQMIDEIKRTTQGKRAAATQVQSAEYLKPLFKTLRSRVCCSSVLFYLC